MDVGEANREFMELSEELYDALIDCHWQLSSVSTERDVGVSLGLPELVNCWNDVLVFLLQLSI